jgi:hypothetical protein
MDGDNINVDKEEQPGSRSAGLLVNGPLRLSSFLLTRTEVELHFPVDLNS